jgi:hypothetical protein
MAKGERNTTDHTSVGPVLGTVLAVYLSRLRVAFRSTDGRPRHSQMVGVGCEKSGPLPTDRGAKSTLADTAGRGSVLSAGVDYISCTAATASRVEMLKATGWAVVYAEAEAGNDLRPWTWKGYDGITSGGASCGLRADGCLVRISGGLAAETWRKAVAWADHISRMDLAVTVRLPSTANPAAEAFANAGQAEVRQRGRSVRAASHIQTWTEGETTYLGSRQSDRYGRLYNKALESHKEEYDGAWRWEVEYKNRASTPVAYTIKDSPSESEAILALVWDQFSKWGVPPTWGRGADVGRLVPPREATDTARRLAWLRTQVAPVVRRLEAMGRRADILEALGLINLKEG